MSAHKLRFHPSKGAFLLRKVLVSAIANAQENYSIAPGNLRIARILVDEGPTLKRITQRAQGRANRINKKLSHITVVVEEYEPQGAIKPHGTKAKPRPKFDAPKKASKKVAETKPVEEEAPVEAIEEATPVEAVEEAPVADQATEEGKEN